MAGGVDVAEEYITSRSMRRGGTLSEARNVGVPKAVIDANNHWRKHMQSPGLTPGMSMMERYSDVKQANGSFIDPVFLKFIGNDTSPKWCALLTARYWGSL
jgi:hypothetical protein